MNLPPSTNFAPAYAAHNPQMSLAFQPNYASSSPFYAHHMPQQQNLFGQSQTSPLLNNSNHTPSPPLATMLQPTLSAITPEVNFIFIL